ncbi:hypothetical protein RhiirC2_781673 [Rhizophagus irregularis]|uniref:Uncharacterized protein n=1 Tax=Rhizophagus irregularis TaxID=588596 RepID=A0A2N1N4W6_9GLOM|nr:hypothetical protein RhiirC2_781673 [Rhizophagus irregularis]
METFLTNTYFHGCKTFIALSEFMGHGANDIFKQLKTCNNCRQRFTQKRKRSAIEIIEINNNQPNILEVIDIDFLSEELYRNYEPPFLIENNLLSYTDNNKDNYHKDLNIIDESTEGDIELFDDLIDTTEKALTLLKEY